MLLDIAINKYEMTSNKINITQKDIMFIKSTPNYDREEKMQNEVTATFTVNDEIWMFTEIIAHVQCLILLFRQAEDCVIATDNSAIKEGVLCHRFKFFKELENVVRPLCCKLTPPLAVVSQFTQLAAMASKPSQKPQLQVRSVISTAVKSTIKSRL